MSIFINDNIKLVQITYNNITSYNYLNTDSINEFAKLLKVNKTIKTDYGIISEYNFKLAVIGENDPSYNDIYQLVNNKFYEAKIDFDKIYKEKPLNIQDDYQLKQALLDIMTETEVLKKENKAITELILTEYLEDDDVSEENEIVNATNLEEYDTITNI
jgi:hypothetical protein